MSKIKLKHSSGNSMSIGAPATNPASDLELKLPATVGTAGQVLKNSSTAGTLEFGSGGIIVQIVNAVYSGSSSFSTSGSTFQDTGLTASITPSSSSNKILIMYQIECASETSHRHAVKLVRGSTDILLSDSAGNRLRASNQQGNPPNNVVMSTFNQTYLDSPSTTSSTTYKLMGWAEANGDFFTNRSEANSDADTHARGVSTITLMEVAV